MLYKIVYKSRIIDRYYFLEVRLVRFLRLVRRPPDEGIGLGGSGGACAFREFHPGGTFGGRPIGFLLRFLKYTGVCIIIYMFLLYNFI